MAQVAAPPQGLKVRLKLSRTLAPNPTKDKAPSTEPEQRSPHDAPRSGAEQIKALGVHGLDQQKLLSPVRDAPAVQHPTQGEERQQPPSRRTGVQPASADDDPFLQPPNPKRHKPAPQPPTLPQARSALPAPPAAPQQPLHRRTHTPEEVMSAPHRSLPAHNVPLHSARTTEQRQQLRPQQHPQPRQPAAPPLINLPSAGTSSSHLQGVVVTPPKVEVRNVVDMTDMEVEQVFSELNGRAYKQKKNAEGMTHAGKPWPVRACLLYTLSGTLYLELAEYSHRLRRAGRSSPNNVSFESTIAFLECAVKLCQNARGNGHVRQALEIMLERLTAMAYMRLFNAEAAAVKRCGEKVRGFLRSAQLAQQQQGQQGGAAEAAAGKQAEGAGGSGKGTSPGDSATSCQDVTALPVAQLTPPVLGQQGSAGAAGGAAPLPPVGRDVTDAQEKVSKTVGSMLRMMEAMHRSVLALQAFVERPEVQASLPLKQAAVHISAVGMELGMYDLMQVVGHARAVTDLLYNVLKEEGRQ